MKVKDDVGWIASGLSVKTQKVIKAEEAVGENLAGILKEEDLLR